MSLYLVQPSEDYEVLDTEQPPLPEPIVFPSDLRAEYPELKPLGEHEGAAVNIRRAFALRFPGQKFSVRTERRGTINVHWTDGPTLAEVEPFAGRHELGHFDGMTDSYSFDRDRAFCDMFGGTQYIFCHRHYSEEAILYALERVKERNWADWTVPTLEDYQKGRAWQMSKPYSYGGSNWYSEVGDCLELRGWYVNDDGRML